jgi:hypothetical protein
MNRGWTALLVVMCAILSLSAALAQNYSPAVTYSTQLQPLGIARADFNEDGKADVVVTNAGSATLSLFLGNGDGTFGNALSIVVGTNPISVASGDFNGDGHQDLAVSLGSSQAVQVLFGNGNSTFQAPVSVPNPNIGHSSIGQIVTGDFNGDHKPDLAVATDLGIAIFTNNGAGGLSETAVVDPVANIANFVIADINRDGRADLLGTELSVDSAGNTAGNVFFALGNGDGTFQAPTPVTQFTGTPAGISVGDVNNDGLADIVFSNSGGVIGGGGGGGPICTPRICLPQDGPPPPPPITIPGEISVLLQQSNTTFSAASSLAGDRNPGEIILSDLNGDGSLDIVDASESTTTPALMVFHNQGNGSFSAPNVLVLPFGAAGLLSASLSNTVALDLAATLPTGNEMSVFVNQGANTLSLTSSENPANAGQPVTLSATVHPSFPSAISGSVIFADGANTLGTSPVSPSGLSTLNASFISAGNHPLTAVYSGSSILVGGSSATLSQKVNLATATVSLASSGTPTVFGQPVSFTITVTPSGPGIIPTGSINLLDGSTMILSGALDGSGKLVANTSSLSLGNHTLIAQYSGDSNYGAATSSSLSQTVNKSNAAVTLSSPINPSVFGQGLAFSVSVSASGGSGIPTGSVTLTESGVPIGSASLSSQGTASFENIILGAGSHSVTAAYTGDQNFGSGTSLAITQVVNKADSSTSLTGVPNPSTFGQSVQLTAVVTGAAGGVPSGTVTFIDGAIQLGSAALTNGKASLLIGTLGTGLHSITAAYGGNGNFNPSSASGTSGVSQNVGKSSTTATISASPNPSTFGQAVIVTAKVAAAGGGSGSPTGMLTFADGATSLGTGTVVGGIATISINSLATGSHGLVASYSGDANFSASQSNVQPQVVNKVSTMTALTSSMNPTTNASSIVLKANVTAATGLPSGVVALFDGAQQLATSQVDPSGRVNFSIANLSAGTHNFTATYGGDTNFAASLANLREEVVDSHAVVVLTSSANPQVVGSAVTFLAAVNPAVGGPANAGLVAFTDSGKVLASVPVANSVASLVTKSLSVGQHQITASFQAGSLPGAFDGISQALTQIINAVPVDGKNFTLNLQDSATTISAGQNFTTRITLTPTNGLTGPVTTACLGAPLGATCSITPDHASFDGRNPLDARLVITTTGGGAASFGGTHGPSNGPQPTRGPERGATALQFGIFPAALLGLVLLPGAKRKAGAFAACAMLALSLTGCGSDSGARGKIPTPSGSYTITVQAESGTLAHSRTFQLKVR